MDTSHILCTNCESLRTSLNEKDNEIERLKLTVEKLRILLSDYDKYSDEKKRSLNLHEFGVKEFSINFYNVEPSNLDKRDRNNHEFFSKSVQTQTYDNLISHNIEEEKNRESDSKLDNQSDYVYDENYQMYYSLSTGYYYDEKSGLMYEPQSQTYYKYNYEKKEYETVPNEPSSNLESASSYNCDVMVHQVNNLNLNDNVSKSDCPEEKSADEASESPNAVKSFDSDDCNLVSFSASEEAGVSSGSTKDWHPAEGSNMTVTDMVKEVINEQNSMSDYVYNESYQMYYSPSTGYYYDSKRKLLYDPSSGIYYSYDAETQKYEFYYQTEPSQPDEEKSNVTEDNAKEERLKSRKLYWRKKLEQPGQILDALKVDNNNEENEFSSPEDGEIFSSDDESIVPSPITGLNSSSINSSDDICPPSIRAIVECSENLKIGSLILITCSGGIIGRDKTSDVCLPDICVSKVHAEITYNNEFQKYSISDLGSQNGTFVNDQRLSEPKEKSDARILNHGDKLCFGSCKLLLHIHESRDTCDHCEPGQVLAEISSQKEKAIVHTSKEDKEKARREELRRMKKKYGLQGADFERKSSSKANQKYEDKAEVRRQTVGSDNPYEKTEKASMDRCVPESNKGFQMLKKMGWIEGQALGSSMSGASEPNYIMQANRPASLNQYTLCSLEGKTLTNICITDNQNAPAPPQVVSLRDIKVVPVIQPSTSSRAGTTFLVTGSPHKTSLKASMEKKQIAEERQKKQSQSKAKKRLIIEDKDQLGISSTKPPKKKTKKYDSSSSNSEDETQVPSVSTDDEDSSSDEDASCPICGKRYSQDKQGEKWVKCSKCFQWYREMCSSSTKVKNLVCDFCLDG